MTEKLFEVHGILNLQKLAGLTSAAAVSRVKRLFPRGTKVGHAGTLDPFATGVLLVLIGRATKQCEALMTSPKQYRATIKLGATTVSDDPESPEQLTPHAKPATREELLAALATQLGEISQIPPVFSALKIGGMRACDRVRAGETVQMQPRTVRIDAIELIDYAWPNAIVKIDCGRGTYIRAIARDIGKHLGVGGYLTQLCRTRVGEYRVEDGVTVETLQAQPSLQSILQFLR